MLQKKKTRLRLAREFRLNIKENKKGLYWIVYYDRLSGIRTPKGRTKFFSFKDCLRIGKKLKKEGKVSMFCIFSIYNGKEKRLMCG